MIGANISLYYVYILCLACSGIFIYVKAAYTVMKMLPGGGRSPAPPLVTPQWRKANLFSELMWGKWQIGLYPYLNHQRIHAQYYLIWFAGDCQYLNLSSCYIPAQGSALNTQQESLINKGRVVARQKTLARQSLAKASVKNC